MGELIELSGYISADQAAKLMGVSRKYLYRIQQYLPPYRVGRSLLYRQEDVERYVETHPRLSRAI